MRKAVIFSYLYLITVFKTRVKRHISLVTTLEKLNTAMNNVLCTTTVVILGVFPVLNTMKLNEQLYRTSELQSSRIKTEFEVYLHYYISSMTLIYDS